MGKTNKKQASYKELFDTLDPAPVWRNRTCVLWLLKKKAYKKKLKTYDYIRKDVHETDVSKDEKYQKRFNGFYRMGRRKPEWYDFYFNLLEKEKHEKISFEVVLKKIENHTGRVEASFASKLVATIDPEKPVWDTFVLQNLNLGRPPSSQPREARIQQCITVYNEICKRVKYLADSPEGARWIKQFDKALPKFKHFTATKKIDLLLWQAGR